MPGRSKNEVRSVEAFVRNVRGVWFGHPNDNGRDCGAMKTASVPVSGAGHVFLEAQLKVGFELLARADVEPNGVLPNIAVINEVSQWSPARWPRQPSSSS